MNIGVFSCDPGGHTGLAWGIFDPGARGGMDEMLRDRLNSGSATVTGDERTQIVEVVEIWQSFYRLCVRDALLPPDRVWFVMENFVLKPGETAGGQDSTIALALIWGIEGYRMGQRDAYLAERRGRKAEIPPMILQMAGEAKSYGNKQRLKDWGIWVVGKEHERSAWSHIACFLKKYQIQGIG